MAKTKAKAVADCGCIDKVNRQLEKYNTAISREMIVNFKTGVARMVTILPTYKIDSKKRGPAKTVLAAYCPVCGKKCRS